jgi:hypothetical protein
MRTVAAVILFMVGLSQMAGDLLQIPLLKGLGLATAVAPAPRVFSAVNGYETYSTRFILELPQADGVRSLELTPALYAHVRGPYNRRNVYGAVLSYGPVLPSSLRDPVARAVLCGQVPLLEELGVDRRSLRSAPSVQYVPRPGTQSPQLPFVLETDCP